MRTEAGGGRDTRHSRNCAELRCEAYKQTENQRGERCVFEMG